MRKAVTYRDTLRKEIRDAASCETPERNPAVGQRTSRPVNIKPRRGEFILIRRPDALGGSCCMSWRVHEGEDIGKWADGGWMAGHGVG